MKALLPFLLLLPLILTQNCISDIQETDAKGLFWSEPSYTPPWVFYPGCKLYTSECLDTYIQTYLNSPLNELSNVTFNDIFTHFLINNCPFFIHGGILRDGLRGVPINDLDVSVTCPTEVAFKLCKDILGEVESEHKVSLCYTNAVGYFFIGRRFIDKGIEGKNWRDTYYRLETQEYTPNMLYYDVTNKLLIDFSTGIEDINNTQIRIPVRRSLWDTWFYSVNTTIGSLETPLYQKWLILKKVCRYWKLRAKGYKDFGVETRNYLINKVVSLWESGNYPMKYSFQVFLCVLMGGRHIHSTGACEMPNGFRNIPASNIRDCRLYFDELYKDFRFIENGRYLLEMNEFPAVKYSACYTFYDSKEFVEVSGQGSFGEKKGKWWAIGLVLGIILVITGF